MPTRFLNAMLFQAYSRFATTFIHPPLPHLEDRLQSGCGEGCGGLSVVWAKCFLPSPNQWWGEHCPGSQDIWP